MAIRKFSRIDWGGLGESFRMSRRTLQPQKHGVRFDLNADDYDADDCNEDITEDGKRSDDYDDITEDGKRSDDDDEDITKDGKRSSWCLVFTLLAIFVAAAVSFIVFPPNTAILYLKAMGANNEQGVSDDEAQQQQQQGRGQEMLELAEQITAACGGGESSSLLRSSSSTAIGTSTCLKLCAQHMCCVEPDDQYSCTSDVMKDCAVYAGCSVLIDDNLW